MSSHTRGPRGRSRKPRPSAGSGSGAGAPRPEGSEDAAGERASAPRPTSGRASRASTAGSRGGRLPAYRDFDQRPQAPWHPLPLSELMILAGAVAFVVGLARVTRHGLSSGRDLIAVGIATLGLGTAEVSWREHRSGFRSHTLLLAFLPVLCLHTVVVFGYGAVAGGSRALNVAMLAVDVVVFGLLARWLRGRYVRARHARR